MKKAESLLHKLNTFYVTAITTAVPSASNVSQQFEAKDKKNCQIETHCYGMKHESKQTD